MNDKLYEIVDEFLAVTQLLDEITDPDPRCKLCINDAPLETRAFARQACEDRGETYLGCPRCEDTGFPLREDTDEELNEAVAEAIDGIELSLQGKVENIMRLCASWDAMAEMIKKEEDRLRSKRKAIEARRERLRTYLRIHMERADLKKIETNVKNVTLTQGRERVEIDDEMALPQGTFTTEYIIKPDKKLLMERFKAKIETEGAHVERGDSFITFR